MPIPDLGLQLFKRANRRIYLTKEGRQVLVAVELRFKAIEQEIVAVIDDVASMDTTIVIGASNEVAEMLLTQKIAAFKQLYPRIMFELVLGNDAQAERDILNGRLDLAFVVFSKDPKLLKVQPYKREMFVTVASRAYLQKHARPIIKLQDILQCDIIDFEPHCPSVKTWVMKNDKKMHAHFEYKTAAIAANDDRMIKRLLLSNMGLANLPRCLVKQELASGELVEILPRSKKLRQA